MARSLWHPAFFQAIQIELEEYRDVLEFESEHQLSEEPLIVDAVIIKKRREIVIKKNIGRVFRTYNIVEYKSPNVSVTVSDYDKVQSYSRSYASFSNIRVCEMSVSVVTFRHPRKLLDYLCKNYRVAQTLPGIYFVEGDTSPTQIVVSSELSEEENLWLTGLSDKLSAERLQRVLSESNIRESFRVGTYVHTVSEANIEVIKELFMGKKLEAVFRELGYIDQWKAEGRAEGYAAGEAQGKAEGETEGQILAILAVLKARFGTVPMKLQKRLFTVTDLTRLETLAGQAALCSDTAVFEKLLK